MAHCWRQNDNGPRMPTDLNSASVRELLDLPGVGPAIAQRIVSARPFTAVSQLQSVRGIGQKRFLAIVSECLVSIGDDATNDKSKSNASYAGQTRPESRSNVNKLVDINCASLEELTTLRGVGPVLAQRIVDARPFRRKEELTAVRGIGLHAYEKLRHQLLDIRRSSSSSSSECQRDDGQQVETKTAQLDTEPYNPIQVESIDFISATFHDTPCRYLVGDIRQTVIPGASRKILVASWNIRNLSRRRDAVPLHRIAEIIEEFDVVAMQEVRDTIVLKKLKNFMPGWDYIASPPAGACIENSQQKRRFEHFVFFYRRRVINPVGVPRIDVSDSSSLQSRTPVVRPPYIASFQVVSDNMPLIDFTLVNIHVVSGDICSRQREVQELRCLAGRLKPRNLCDQRNCVLVGDFNLAPHDIGNIGEDDFQFEPLVLSPMSTTVGGKLFDNIWLSSCGDWTDFLVESGVYRVDWAFYPQSRGLPRQLETSETRMRAQAARARCSLELSDHYPVWLALGENINMTGE